MPSLPARSRTSLTRVEVLRLVLSVVNDDVVTRRIDDAMVFKQIEVLLKFAIDSENEAVKVSTRMPTYRGLTVVPCRPALAAHSLGIRLTKVHGFK